MDKSEGGTVVRGLEEVKAEKGASAAKQQETAPREEKKPDGLDVSAFADDIGVKKAEGGFAAAQKTDDSMVKDFLAAYVRSEAEVRRLSARLKEAEKTLPAEEVLKRPDVIAAAAHCPEVEKAVIENYLKRVSDIRVPSFMGGTGESPVSECHAPKTLKEANALAEKFFNRQK